MTLSKCEDCKTELTKDKECIVLDHGYFVCMCNECRLKRIERYRKEKDKMLSLYI